MRAQVEDNVPEKRCVIAAMADREDRLRGRRQRWGGEGAKEREARRRAQDEQPAVS